MNEEIETIPRKQHDGVPDAKGEVALEKKNLPSKSSCGYIATTFGSNERLLSFPELQKIIPISKARWYEMMALGEAPKPIKISRHRVAWLSSELTAFLNDRIAKRNATRKSEGTVK